MSPWLPIVLPALVSVATFVLGERRGRARAAVNLFGALASAVAVIVLAVRAFDGVEASGSVPLFPGVEASGSVPLLPGVEASGSVPLLPGVALGVSADLLGLLFSAVATILWCVTLVYAIGYMDHAKDRARFFGFFALCIAAANGVALAEGPLSFFIFYEVLSLATYPLVVHSGTNEALAAGRKYLLYALGGGAALLVGVVWLYVLAGPTPFTPGGALGAVSGHVVQLRVIFALMALGFGVKAALMPLHGWLPGAMVAPAPVSSLLHAVAVVKAGVFGIVRLVNELYGPELATSLGVARPLAVLAAVSIVVASVIALRQDDLKRRLAYSTIAQLSYITLGTALCTPLAAVGALAHLAHHAVMKITMFFTAGSLAETLHVKKVSQLPGVARRMPLTMASFALAALALAGIPPLAGFYSKWLLGAGAAEGGAWWATLVYVASGALAMGYMLPILITSLRPGELKPANRTQHASLGAAPESDLRMLVPIVVVGVGTLVLGLTAGLPASPVGWALRALAPTFGVVVP